MTDLVTFGETMLRLSPPDGERVDTTDELSIHVGGAESNVAVAASRLGVETCWISKLPDSPLGDRVVNGLREVGVEVDVVRGDGRQGLYVTELGGKPRGIDVLYDRERSALTTVTPDELPTRRIAEADCFFTSGITPALSDRLAKTTAGLLQFASEQGVETAMDVNYRSKLWSPERARETLSSMFSPVDVLVVPLRDARELFGFEQSEAPEVAHGLASQFEFDTVVVTRGANGAVGLHDGVIYEQPAFEAETIDPIGTGDAFTGAFLARRVAGHDVADALAYGAATASIKRTIRGDVATIRRDEVERVVDEGTTTISR